VAKPTGTPISQALIVRRLEPDPRGLTERVHRAIAAIDRVHGDGDLPPLTVEWGQLTAGEEAIFDVIRFGNQIEMPQRIIVSTRARRPGLAILYEIGHLLDHQAIGDRGHFASMGHQAMSEWRQAVLATHAMAELQRQRDMRQPASLAKHLAYAVPPDELWERSYAQSIVRGSDVPELLAEVDERRRRMGSFFIPYLWDDDDFEPVAQAIDSLFRRLGWRR
jgi:hypothetical protein